MKKIIQNRTGDERYNYHKTGRILRIHKVSPGAGPTIAPTDSTTIQVENWDNVLRNNPIRRSGGE